MLNLAPYVAGIIGNVCENLLKEGLVPGAGGRGNSEEMARMYQNNKMALKMTEEALKNEKSGNSNNESQRYKFFKKSTGSGSGGSGSGTGGSGSGSGMKSTTTGSVGSERRGYSYSSGISGSQQATEATEAAEFEEIRQELIMDEAERNEEEKNEENEDEEDENIKRWYSKLQEIEESEDSLRLSGEKPSSSKREPLLAKLSKFPLVRSGSLSGRGRGSGRGSLRSKARGLTQRIVNEVTTGVKDLEKNSPSDPAAHNELLKQLIEQSLAGVLY